MRPKYYQTTALFILYLGTQPVSAWAADDLPDLLKMSLAELVNITITSQKREEKLQNNSQSVSALSSSYINHWQISDIMDLEEHVPGLKLGRTGYDPRPAMRGVRTQTVEHNDTGVSIYHNGIYKPRHAQAIKPYLDVERIEVIRGPQGTLFGRNSFGGTIQIINHKPKLNKNTLNLELGTADYDQQFISAIANVEVTNNSALRVSFLKENQDTIISNDVNKNAGLRDKNTLTANVQYFLEFNQNSSLRLSFEHWQEDSNGFGMFGSKVLGSPLNYDTNLSDPNEQPNYRIARDNICGSSCGRYGAGLGNRETSDLDSTNNISKDPYTISADYKPSQKIKENQLSLEYNYNFSGSELKMLAADMNFDDERLEDGDFSEHASVIEGYDMHSDSQTIELQLTSNTSAPLQWLGGYYYLKEELSYAFIWQDLVDLVDNKPASVLPKNEWASWLSQLNMSTRSQSIYGQLKYSLTEKLNVFSGLRYTHDQRNWQVRGQDPSNLTVLNFNQNNTDKTKNNWDSSTWRIGAEYQLNNNSFIYTSASTGFLAGNYKRNTESYDEQKVTAYEIGSKNLLLNDKLRANISFYHNEFKDLLSTTFTDTGGTTVGTVDNSGAINSQGIELELDWQLSDELLLGFKGDKKRARYGDFIIANQFQTGGQNINNVDNLYQLNDSQVELSPDYSYSLFSQYSINMHSWGNLTPALRYYKSGGYRTSSQPYLYGEQKDFERYSASLNWQSKDKHWQVNFYFHNIKDEQVKIRANRYGGNVAVLEYADPKILGAKLSYSFSN